MRPTQPIGVFDSGLGGLSVLRELARRLPGEDFIYVGDSAHCPYGALAADAIVARAILLCEYLLQRGAKMIVVACNTATVAAVQALRARYPVPFVGMEPAVKPAARLTRSGVVGVLATQSTAGNARLQSLIRTHAQTVEVLTQPCPGLVERVEVGDLDGAQTRALVSQYTQPLLARGADVLVLGCTHYPFLRPLIQGVAGADVVLLDTGEAVAQRAVDVLARAGMRRDDAHCGNVQWFSSGDPLRFEAVAQRLWPSAVLTRALPETVG